MLISRPSPFPKLVQRSRRPISTAATTFDVPGRKDDSIGTVILSVFGFRRKNECSTGNAIAYNRYYLVIDWCTMIVTHGASNGS